MQLISGSATALAFSILKLEVLHVLLGERTKMRSHNSLSQGIHDYNKKDEIYINYQVDLMLYIMN